MIEEEKLREFYKDEILEHLLEQWTHIMVYKPGCYPTPENVANYIDDTEVYEISEVYKQRISKTSNLFETIIKVKEDYNLEFSENEIIQYYNINHFIVEEDCDD